LTLKDRVAKLEDQLPQPLKVELDDGQVVVMDNPLDLLCRALEAMREGDNDWLNSNEAYAIVHAKRGQHSTVDLVRVLIESYQDKKMWE
jgi:hypothetical protein